MTVITEFNSRITEESGSVSLQAARQYCRELAQTHYENFTVVSWLLPRWLHQHFYNVYAYCRWADDLGDEITNSAGQYDRASRQRSLNLLAWWRSQLRRCYGQEPWSQSEDPVPSAAADALGAEILQQAGLSAEALHPVMVALRDTIGIFGIPPEPFLDLITAFEQDQRVAEYDTYEQLLAYCRYSANPVGRLVIYLCRAYDEESAHLSDCVCTGLQLTNFWQDVARDLDRGRIYLPRSDRRLFGYSDEDLRRRAYNVAFRELMRLEVARARNWLQSGLPLVDRIPRSLQVDIELFVRGGLTILDKIEGIDYNVWRRRPVLSKWDHLRLLAACAAKRAARAVSGNRPASFDVSSTRGRARWAPDAGGHANPVVRESYRYCCGLARRAAKNFYYSFLALPPARRRAMCALYAFLRTTDDIGDGPGTAQRRRRQLDAWRRSLGRGLEGCYDHPVLPALHETVRRYSIAPEYLYGAIDGVATDLGVVRYATFEELSRYCYQVASVVGFSCIAIWGHRGREALQHAHQCGMAFQLTNILRDLKEDAQRDRIYLPLEDLQRFGYPPEDLRQGRYSAAFRELMRFQVDRVRGYYRQGAKLIGSLEPAGRPVFRTMYGIYYGILEEIERNDYDVFTQRVGLKPWRKALILARSLSPTSLAAPSV